MKSSSPRISSSHVLPASLADCRVPYRNSRMANTPAMAHPTMVTRNTPGQ